MWEEGTNDPENPYPHTHFAFEMTRKIDLSSPRAFDYKPQDQEIVHPNITPIKSLDHANQIYTEYHHKHPLLLTQSEQAPIRAQGQLDLIVKAKSLKEAVQISGVEIKTVRDLQLLRQDRQERQQLPSLPNLRSWTFDLEPSWRSLWLSGPSGVGKSQWAIAQFECPLLVSHMDDLKQFSSDLHDGLIFDDMSFQHFPRGAAIHLVDWDLPRSLNVKHGCVTIPAHTRKIFTTNVSWDEFWPQDDAGAIRRRCTIVRLPTNMKLFTEETPQRQDEEESGQTTTSGPSTKRPRNSSETVSTHGSTATDAVYAPGFTPPSDNLTRTSCPSEIPIPIRRAKTPIRTTGIDILAQAATEATQIDTDSQDPFNPMRTHDEEEDVGLFSQYSTSWIDEL